MNNSKRMEKESSILFRMYDLIEDANDKIEKLLVVFSKIQPYEMRFLSWYHTIGVEEQEKIQESLLSIPTKYIYVDAPRSSDRVSKAATYLSVMGDTYAKVGEVKRTGKDSEKHKRCLENYQEKELYFVDENLEDLLAYSNEDFYILARLQLALIGVSDDAANKLLCGMKTVQQYQDVEEFMQRVEDIRTQTTKTIETRFKREELGMAKNGCYFIYNMETKKFQYGGESWSDWDEDEITLDEVLAIQKKMDIVIILGREEQLHLEKEKIKKIVAGYEERNIKVAIGLVKSVNSIKESEHQLLQEIGATYKIMILDTDLKYLEETMIQMFTLDNDIEVTYDDFSDQFKDADIIWFYGLYGTALEPMAHEIAYFCRERQEKIASAMYLLRGDVDMDGISAVSKSAESEFPNADVLVGSHIDGPTWRSKCIITTFLAVNMENKGE